MPDRERPTVLVTGFEAFGGMPGNPTAAVVSALGARAVDGVELHTLVLPVDYARTLTTLVAEVDRLEPDAVLCLGLAAGRTAVTPERVGLNVQDTGGSEPIPDNAGDAPRDRPVVTGPESPDALFATLPVRTMVDDLLAAGVPAYVSSTAGTYLCNTTLYGVLEHLRRTRPGVPAGFVHVPASTALALTDPTWPSMSPETIDLAVRTVLGTVARHLGAREGSR